MIWPKTTIITDQGEPREAIAPLIISASRSTDIPAFHGPWFMRRLEAGYVRWVNPWNGKSLYVSLSKVQLIVFWTKNPKPFLPCLEKIDREKINYCIHFTLNDYEAEGLEEGVPPLAARIELFRELAGRIGKERVLWRFDPLIITDALPPATLLARIRSIGDQINDSTERLTISFLSLYDKVKRNLKNRGIALRMWDDTEREIMLAGIGKCLVKWKLHGFSCAEAADYSQFGIVPGKCIDDALIARLFSHDSVLMEFIKNAGKTRDNGQRPSCRCIMSKDIGRYNTCGHQCCYCYANTSPHRASCICRSALPHGDSIIA